MRLLLILLLPLTLTGCITIQMPPVQPSAPQAAKPISSCPVYQRAPRERLPANPELHPSEMADLEALGIKLAGHIRRLYDYINESEQEESKAYSRYLDNCKPE